ncbi:hypothetical protein HanPI659440_Chr13g0489031 [Helianthus annuus]|nr:hypothetical protein HanPI659440_Chr13g0489031 [Helianthus annuus]
MHLGKLRKYMHVGAKVCTGVVMIHFMNVCKYGVMYACMYICRYWCMYVRK